MGGRVGQQRTGEDAEEPATAAPVEPGETGPEQEPGQDRQTDDGLGEAFMA